MPPPRRMTHPARSFLELYRHPNPEIWRTVDRVRAARKWPDSVFLSMGGAVPIEVTQARMIPETQKECETIATRANLLEMLSAWRVTQGIYRFDPDVYESVIETPITGELPAEQLQCLPEWCVYLETPGMRVCGDSAREQLGVWAWLDWDEHGKQFWLRLMGLQAGGWFDQYYLPLEGTLESAVSSAMKGAGFEDPVAQGLGERVRWTTPIVSLLLYLVSEACDFGDAQRRPGNPRPVRTKDGVRQFPADKPTQWDVGVRMGAALRAARAQQAAQTQGEDREKRTVRPHVRRAHWAHRWIGPRSGERKSIVRWIHPALVNAKTPDGLPAVIRPVPGPRAPQDP